MNHTDFIQNFIMRDMSEGVMSIGFDGVINYLNPAAEKILEQSAETLTGKPFASVFFDMEGTDDFTQLVLDAVYDRTATHEGIVDYPTLKMVKQLHVKTSFLHDGEETIGIICVISDVSELAELRDALKAMKRIQAMNNQLELRNKLLSETFGRFLSDEIVRQLLETPDGLALGGKKRTLSIMMSDLRGFTAISERMEPHALLDMLNHYLGAMTEIIQRNNGTIIEFIGDGIMAIYGAPAPSERHAAEAVQAAVEMEAAMVEVNKWNAERGYPMLEMGIGINTGDVIVGNIGSEKRTKYGVVGSHVNLAGRIESYTVGGQILIAPYTRQQITDELTVAGEQQVMPKGVAQPLTLSHVVGIGGVSCQQKAEEPKPLDKPVPAPFYCIHEKHIDESPRPGEIVALCHSGAALRTAEEMPQYMNLQLDIGGKLFAKVLSGENGEYLLRFTSKPICFDDWYQQSGGKK